MMALHKKFSNFHMLVNSLLGFTESKKGCMYRVEKIDVVKNTVSIYCKGTSTLFSFLLADIVNDEALVCNLSSRHASWVGYYYGRQYKELVLCGKRARPPKSFEIYSGDGKCSIVAASMNGKISYLEHQSNKVYSCFALDIVKNSKRISCFNQTQACYIGVLAGIEAVKKERSAKLHRNVQGVRFLRLVK